jgi:hypothetical protein
MRRAMRKGSIELSVNFLVVIIISIVLLGIGIALMTKFIKGSDVLRNNVGVQEQEMLKETLSAGSRVALVPSIRTVERGGYADFDLGISNELGQEQSFVVRLEVDRPQSTIKTNLYDPGPHVIKNNEQDFVPIRLKIPKETTHGTYIFYLYVCNTTIIADCYIGCPDCMYGLMQKPQINVK